MKIEQMSLAIVALILGMTSCMHMENVPYAVTEPECMIGNRDYEHDFAGIHFVFYNNTEKIVTGFKCSFIVFDSTGELNPLIGSNILSLKYTQLINSQDKREIVFSLDPYIQQIPSEPYLVDFFYVSRIEYEDGSVWTDPYGAWMPGGL